MLQGEQGSKDFVKMGKLFGKPVLQLLKFNYIRLVLTRVYPQTDYSTIYNTPLPSNPYILCMREPIILVVHFIAYPNHNSLNKK